MRIITCLLLFLGYTFACTLEPTYYQSKRTKISGDNDYEIKISENPQKYVPGNVYPMYIMAPRDSSGSTRRFSRFTINVQSTNGDVNSPQNVGNFQLYPNTLVSFKEDCINTISERDASPKTDIFFMWSAPPPGSGCVTFRAMILEDGDHWYSEDGRLTKTICEQSENDIKFDDTDCCACDEAKYNLIFEGIWSKQTHPRDFPTTAWLTHFSDVIGASHERNFSFWGEGHIASEGFRSLAEWGSVRLMETEIRAKHKFLRTIIKASGLWYPEVNTNTSTNFKVDRKHPFISIASMFGPSPDWVVGVNGLNLCLKNCTWMENLVLDLYPYDAGVDGGISYMSPNAETLPRERMYRITTTYPEDPRAPFYDPSKREMHPLARLYLRRDNIIPRNCDESFLSAQIDVSENTEDGTRLECQVGDWSEWTACSVSCGKGLRVRTRSYSSPVKATAANCNRQLVSKEMCVASTTECPSEPTKLESEEALDSLAGDTDSCATSPWSGWSPCSATCGNGYSMRTRKFVDRMGRKKCPHVTTMEKVACSASECLPDQIELPDPTCPTTEWSDWSPCSASCGKGIKIRTRLLLVEPEMQQTCSTRVELMQQYPCEDVPSCELDMNTAKVVCMQDTDPGPCQGYFNRWSFDSAKLLCLPFIYGGCRGNRNNFLTSDQCYQACSIVRDAINGNLNPAAIFNTNPNQSPSFPVDCEVSEWTEWGPCNKSCGLGVKERFRIVTRPAQNGGRRCPHLVRRKACYAPPC